MYQQFLILQNLSLTRFMHTCGWAKLQLLLLHLPFSNFAGHSVGCFSRHLPSNLHFLFIQYQHSLFSFSSASVFFSSFSFLFPFPSLGCLILFPCCFLSSRPTNLFSCLSLKLQCYHSMDLNFTFLFPSVPRSGYKHT